MRGEAEVLNRNPTGTTSSAEQVQQGVEAEKRRFCGTYRSLAQGLLHSREIADWAPDFANEALVCDVEAALVEDEVDGLHLLYPHSPGWQHHEHLLQHLGQILLRLA